MYFLWFYGANLFFRAGAAYRDSIDADLKIHELVQQAKPSERTALRKHLHANKHLVYQMLEKEREEQEARKNKTVWSKFTAFLILCWWAAVIAGIVQLVRNG